MVAGSCLCGDTRFEVDPSGGRISHCHCSMCRKAHAAPFVSWLSAPAAGFRWSAGEERVAHYRSSEWMNRAFCPRCGSALPAVDGETVDVPAGCLDDDPGVRPSRHIFYASHAPWLTVNDDLPRHDTDADGGPVVEQPAPPPATAEGVLRGSCLCRKVRYEVTEPFRAVFNCHCRRCRKARAAAHTTNGFVSAEGMRFLSGQEQIVEYKLPEAKYFTHSFCGCCGSGVPRISAERGIAVIPFGTLDDDPGQGAGAHIFTAYKAPWFEIGEDGLKRFEEGPG